MPMSAPLKIGLTGPPAAGKTTLARMFAGLGAPVFDADAAVAALYAPGGAAVEPLIRRWPEARAQAGGIDRAALREIVQSDPQALAALEEIVHPLVAEQRRRFIARAKGQGAPYVVLEIPLLFETGAERELDKVIYVDAPRQVRLERLRARPGFSANLLHRLESRLLPEEERRARADIIIDTHAPLDEVEQQVRALHEQFLSAARHS
jgi:dephospho-CoA kinase